MESSFWVLCSLTLLCLANVRCSSEFKNEDDNFLDKTIVADLSRTENDQDIDWELYKARKLWNDLTNEISQLSRAAEEPKVDEKTCKNEKKNCVETGGSCDKEEDDTITCKCPESIGYDPEFGCKIDESTCENDLKPCADTKGYCIKVNDQLTCKCPEKTEYETENGCTDIDFCPEVCGNDPEVTCTGDKSNKEDITCGCKDDKKEFDKTSKLCKDIDFCPEVCGNDLEVTCNGDKSNKEDITCGCKDDKKEFDKTSKLCKDIDFCPEVCGNDPEVTCSGDKSNKEDVTCGCKDDKKEFDKTSKLCKDKCAAITCYNDGTCIVENGKAICSCVNSFEGEKCEKFPKEECAKKLENCAKTDGTCVTESADKVTCVCPNNKEWDDNEGCKDIDPCKSFVCHNKGKCIKKEDGSLKCDCGTTDGYTGDKCEKVPDDKCEEVFSECSSNEGTCIKEDGKDISCSCKDNKEYVKGYGCIVNYCKEVCGDKEGVKCEGDLEVKPDIVCTCTDDKKSFDTTDKQCKVDKCLEKCGVHAGEKNKEVKCTGDPFKNANCKCIDAKKEFDPQTKTCRVNYCKEKCGSITCTGDKFDENKVTCKCPSDYQDFDGDTKKCKTNYCKKMCGMDPKIKCDDPNNENLKAADCECEDTDFVFLKKTCIKKCSEDDDCKNEGKCEDKGDYKLCKCKVGIKGDMCEKITACEEVKYKECKGERGECVFEKGKASCKCPDGKDIFTSGTLEYCEKKCKKDDDCSGSNKKCKNNFCMCQDGYEGDDCTVVSGCKDLKKKCEDIGTKCVFDKDAEEKATCECKDKGFKYDRVKNKCQDPFCYPDNPCKDGECKYDASIGSGYCECSGDKYYNFAEGKCIGLPEKCLIKKTPCKENEVCEKGKCVCKFKKEGDECKRDFCTPNPCFPGAKCKAEDQSCYCEETKYFNGQKCVDIKCPLKEFKEKCVCPNGLQRKEDSSDCETTNDKSKICDKDCGYGICVETNEKQSCKCFGFAKLEKDKCILNADMCPGKKLQKEDPRKCSCTDKYTQADDDITCRFKTCDDKGVKEECAAKGAECKMDWKNGYYCKCPDGYQMNNEKCTDPCSVEKNIRECANDNKFCYNSLSPKNKETGNCVCPPTVKEVDGKCASKADYVYLVRNIYVLKDKYEIKSGINKVLLNADLMDSMKQTFDNNLQNAYLFDYRISGNTVICSVWISFDQKTDEQTLTKLKRQPKKFSCDNCDESKVVWPPRVLLSTKGLEEVTFTPLKFCSPEVKNLLCGQGAKCTEDGQKCICDEGFKLIEYSIRDVGGYGVQRCEDIDECALGIDKCSGNTSCINTFGSYRCDCKAGYKKAKVADNPEKDQNDCVDLCTPSPCKKGKCVLKDKTFDCECSPGVAGSLCDHEDVNYASAKKSTVVVGAVLGTILIIGALALLYYIIKIKKSSGSGDFMPTPRMDNAEMAERRGMRGVTNRAYE